MIRIHRSTEPSGLASIRPDRLDAAREARANGRAIDFHGYDVVKPELFAMQHRKCCYCEKLEEQAKYRDVEHYRPKADYWWLAWTWDNLMFACFECNREHKQERFPLADGSVALRPEDAPPGEEQPLVIDPCDPNSDPTQEIVFRRDRVHGRERWVPYGTTPRGWTTIDVCGLDRPNLLDLYGEHVRNLVRPKLEPVVAALRSREAPAVVRAWSTTTRALLGAARPFRALSHDALAVLVAEDVRRRYKLSLERPGLRSA